jgi:tetratricopeptide (TPR) repeat protein
MAVAVAALLTTGTAWGAPTDDPDTEVARRHFVAGVSAYDRADYETALREFRTAQRARPRPAFDFNIGRCLDRMERYAEAIEAYQRFAAAAPDDPEAAEARARVTTLQARLQSERGHPSTPAATGAAGDVAAVAATSSSTTEAIDTARAHDARRRRRLAAALGGGGGALIIGGVALGLGLGLSSGSGPPATQYGNTMVEFR